MRTQSLLAAVCFVLACSKPVVPVDETPPDAAPPDAAMQQELALCLDRPGELPRPPTGRLPCELLPPGLRLQTR